MKVDIPGRESIEVRNIIFDYNGTIAVDGLIKESIKEDLGKLSKEFNVYVLTADTYGSAKSQCESLGIEVVTFPRENASIFKNEFLERLGKNQTICVGNGFNDIEMCKNAVLSIGILDREGIASSLILSVDIVASGIESAIEIILNKNRIIATLRS